MEALELLWHRNQAKSSRLSISRVYRFCQKEALRLPFGKRSDKESSEGSETLPNHAQTSGSNSGELVFPITHSVNGICRISPRLRFDCSTLQQFWVIVGKHLRGCCNAIAFCVKLDWHWAYDLVQCACASIQSPLMLILDEFSAHKCMAQGPTQ